MVQFLRKRHDPQAVVTCISHSARFAGLGGSQMAYTGYQPCIPDLYTSPAAHTCWPRFAIPNQRHPRCAHPVSQSDCSSCCPDAKFVHPYCGVIARGVPKPEIAGFPSSSHTDGWDVEGRVYCYFYGRESNPLVNVPNWFVRSCHLLARHHVQ